MVPVYDHYCGFLFNAIGRDNYLFFFCGLGECVCVRACACMRVCVCARVCVF